MLEIEWMPGARLSKAPTQSSGSGLRFRGLRASKPPMSVSPGRRPKLSSGHSVRRVIGISALGRGTPWAAHAGYEGGQMTPAAAERNRSAFRAWLGGRWLHAAEAKAQSAACPDGRPDRRHREGKTTRTPAPSTWTSTRGPRPLACPRAVSHDLDCSGPGVQFSAQFMAAVLSRAFVVEAQAAAWHGGDGNIAQRPSAARAGNRARYRNVP